MRAEKKYGGKNGVLILFVHCPCATDLHVLVGVLLHHHVHLDHVVVLGLRDLAEHEL